GGQPANGSRIDPVRPRNVSLGFTGGEPFQRFSPLELIQLRRPAELYAAGLGALATSAGPSPDELTLELSQAAENRQHQPAVWGGVVGPAVVQALEPGLLGSDFRQNIEQIPGATG